MRKIAGYKFQRRHRDTHTQIDTHSHRDRECASHIALATRTWASATRIRIELANVYGIPIGHRAGAEMLPLSGFFFVVVQQILNSMPTACAANDDKSKIFSA